MTHAKPGTTMCQRILDRRRESVETEPFAGWFPERTKFHRQDCVIASGAHYLADRQFGLARSIEVADINQVDPGIEGRMDCGEAFTLVGFAVIARHAHAP